MNHPAGSNTITLYDTRDGAAEAAQASISDNLFSYSGPRHIPAGAGCDSLTAAYHATLSDGGHFSGSGTFLCAWTGGSCNGTTTVVGSKPGDYTAPSPPTGLTASAASANQINLSWNAATDNVAVTGYKVYRNNVFLKNAAGTGASDTGLTASTNYCYSVSAVDAAANQSAQSSQACATTLAGGGGGDTTAPATPSGLVAAAASASQINLTWNASTDNIAVTGYKVYRGGAFLKEVTSANTSDTGLTASTNYCYTVSAVDAAANESAQSTQACATTQAGGGDATAPSVPTGLTATGVSQSQVDLAWNAATDNVGVVGYKVYRGAYLKTVTGTSASVTGLNTMTKYGFSVTAIDAAGNESGYATASAYTYDFYDLPVIDEVEPNNTSGTAQQISVPIDVISTSTSTTDLDYFQFNPPTTRSYDVSVQWTSAGGSNDYAIYLYDQTQSLIGTGAVSMARTKTITMTLPTGVMYTVKVTPLFTMPQIWPYTLLIQ